MRNISILIVCFFAFSPFANAHDIEWKETTIPMEAAGPNGLETLLVYPTSPGKHPLALISHGSPRDVAARKKMTAISFLPIAMEFARRGFSVAVVLRRGYGNSGNEWHETYGTCNSPNYLQAAKSSSEDLHTAINYLGTLPQFDTSRMIAVGVSAGGFATVALTADNPPKGLVAAISFAAGRGSTADDSVCQENTLIQAFAEMGKTSRVPMLWVYAKNDHFFDQVLAEKFYKVFTENGGKVTFVQPEQYGTEGHFLFSTAGISQWTPIVDNFLSSQNLVLVNKPLAVPTTANLPAPSNLSAKGKQGFKSYLAGPPHKAFATAADGAYAWKTGQHTTAEAKQEALTACEGFTKSSECTLYAVDDGLVNQ